MPIKWHLAPVVFSRFSDFHRWVISHKDILMIFAKYFFSVLTLRNPLFYAASRHVIYNFLHKYPRILCLPLFKLICYNRRNIEKGPFAKMVF